ncbi:MAG: Hsp33 family molecular chaperone HslO [Deinococcales bacterium]
MNFLLSGTAANTTLRVFAVQTTQLVQTAKDKHLLSPTATAALGRSLSGALLLAQVLSKRPQDRVTLRIQGDGVLGHIVAEGGRDGSARGYVKNPAADLPPRISDGKLDVGALVGKNGDLAVMRLLENSEPYTGSVPLASGEIADDLAVYLWASEQIPSAVLLGVHLDNTGVTQAGGLLVQAMPGASETDLARLEQNITALGQLTSAMRQFGLLGTMQKALEGLDLEMTENSLALEYKCRCSQERSRASLVYFSAQEHQEMIDAGGQEVVCHWCGTRYFISPEEIAQL